MSAFHPSRSITAATKTGPFIALEAAMNAPSGDQLVESVHIGRPDLGAPTDLRRRKKVDLGELANGLSTLCTNDQSPVSQILTVLSSDLSNCQLRKRIKAKAAAHLCSEKVTDWIPTYSLDEISMQVEFSYTIYHHHHPTVPTPRVKDSIYQMSIHPRSTPSCLILPKPSSSHLLTTLYR